MYYTGTMNEFFKNRFEQLLAEKKSIVDVRVKISAGLIRPVVEFRHHDGAMILQVALETLRLASEFRTWQTEYGYFMEFDWVEGYDDTSRLGTSTQMLLESLASEGDASHA